MNGEMKNQLFSAQVNKYKNCLEARLFRENIDPAVYTQLIESIHKNLEPLWRFLKLKQTLLGLKMMKYDDIYASAVNRLTKNILTKKPAISFWKP